jgi:predicted DCC family thiol-disulfide oxidoreductase YuxK
MTVVLDEDDRPLVGADAIAAALGMTPRQVRWLALSDQLPIRRLGSRLMTTRRWLREGIQGKAPPERARVA